MDYRILKKGLGIAGKARKVGEIVSSDDIGDTTKMVAMGLIEAIGAMDAMRDSRSEIRDVPPPMPVDVHVEEDDQA